MGTDIHTNVERKNPRPAHWEVIDGIYPFLQRGLILANDNK